MNMYFYHAVLTVDDEVKEIHGIVGAEDALSAYRAIDAKLTALTKTPDAHQIRAFNNVK